MTWILITWLMLMQSPEGQSSTYQESTQTAKPRPNEWKGLWPLRSTRSDVERLLGKPAMPPAAFEIYKTEEERVDVLYSAGPCGSSPLANWNVTKDVVISMHVMPQKTISIESLHLDPKKYVRLQESHPENWVQYWNRDDGVIVHSILQGKEEYLYFIEYMPSAKDKSLRCSTNQRVSTGPAPSVLSQDQYSLPACTASSASGKVVGGRIKLHLPKAAILKQGRDVDYSDYAVGFGPKKSRVWLQGIYGPMATSGRVPEDWLSASVEVTRRTWKFADLEGVDAKGKLANGNYWRYVGQYGESIRYYDVPAEAAAYFDGLLNSICFLDWR